jgi:hypothetical protein
MDFPTKQTFELKTVHELETSCFGFCDLAMGWQQLKKE